MASPLKTLLAGLIDYAGLFPPARLPLEQAFRNYARYRTQPDSWMLGRFICPAARLAELAPFLDEMVGSGPPFRFSALGQGGNTAPEFLTGLQADREALDSFHQRHGERGWVDVFEARLPEDVVRKQEPAAVSTLVEEAAVILGTRSPSLTAYYEAHPGPSWRASLGAAIAGIVQSRGASFKLRCGGLDTAAFPSAEQVAFVLTACRDAGAPLKCTAGLHHPIRRFDSSVRTVMHGFVNVFGAGVLAFARRLDEERVRSILEDEDPSNFGCDVDGFRWKDIRANTAEIAAARQNAVVSFGSCSFDEPRADLRALGWLSSEDDS